VTNAEQLRSIALVHAAYAQHFNGTFVRDDPAYWHKWLAYEFTRDTARSALALDAATGLVVGYASAFVKEDDHEAKLSATSAEHEAEVSGRYVRVRVREFGVVDELVAGDGGQTLLGSLVGFLLQSVSDSDDGHRRVRLVFPAAIENYFQRTTDTVVPDGRREESQVDEGTMLRVLDVGTEVELEQALRQRPSAAHSVTPEQHQASPESSSYLLFWEPDGF
jgi:hypothetical protein